MFPHLWKEIVPLVHGMYERHLRVVSPEERHIVRYTHAIDVVS